MKKFLANIVIGSLLFLFLWCFVEMGVKKVYVRNAYSYKYHYVKDNPNINTLLLGNSLFEFGVNPYLLGNNVFNMAKSGRWIYYDVHLSERLFSTMPNLKTVIFPLGYNSIYFSLHYQPISDFSKGEIYNYTRFMDIPYDHFPESILYGSSLLSNKLGVKYWRWSRVDSLGYNKRDEQLDHWEKRDKFDPFIYRNDTSCLCYEEYKDYLMQLAKTCDEDAIRLVLVTCPCADYYLKNVHNEGLKKLNDLVDFVRTSYPAVEYYDYLNDLDFRSDSLYLTPAHLNAKGADKFAIRLKNDIGL